MKDAVRELTDDEVDRQVREVYLMCLSVYKAVDAMAQAKGYDIDNVMLAMFTSAADYLSLHAPDAMHKGLVNDLVPFMLKKMKARESCVFEQRFDA